MKEPDLSVHCRVELSDPGWQINTRALMTLVARIVQLIRPELSANPGVRRAVAVSCYVVPASRMRQLNRTYRGIDSSTDMLSFPMGCAAPGRGWVLGDIVICMDAVESKGVSSGNSTEDQLAFSLVHSMLHLVGFDHMEEHDRMLMEQREEDVFAKLVPVDCLLPAGNLT
ncbi:MAG: rRNA maturation RNase YbeY [Candidatus Cryosericum sp.]